MVESIRLRKVRQNDFFFLKSLLQNEELMLTGWGKIYTDEEVAGWIEKIRQQYLDFGYSYYIVESQKNESIGIAGIIRTTIQSTNYDELAYIIKKEYQGQGYGTAIARKLVQVAFEDYRLSQIIAQVVSENTASRKILENLGMSYHLSYSRIQNEVLKEHFIYLLKNKNSY